MRMQTLVAFVGALFVVVGCSSSRVSMVEEFRSAREAGDLERARAALSEDPRVWYEAREGPGSPWRLGGGRWKEWDKQFRSKSVPGPWHVEGRTVWRVNEEWNDYFRLIEREETPRYRITYFFDEAGLIEGYMISAADPDTPSKPSVTRFDEAEAWALANEPEEWAHLRPGGSLDPTGDRAARTRALLNRWRVSVGLEVIE